MHRPLRRSGRGPPHAHGSRVRSCLAAQSGRHRGVRRAPEGVPPGRGPRQAGDALQGARPGHRRRRPRRASSSTWRPSSGSTSWATPWAPRRTWPTPSIATRAHPRRRPPQGHLSRAGPHGRLHDDARDGGRGRRAHARSRAHRRAAVGDEPALRQPLRHFDFERIVRSLQRPGKLATEDVKSIESARKIYRALGDYRSVVRLYELELEGTADAKRRADLLLGLGRVLGEKLEELDARGLSGSTRSCACVPATRRRSSCSRASTPTRTGSAPTASSARRRSTSRSRDGGKRRATPTAPSRRSARALATVPGHPESGELLERIYYDARHASRDLDRYYRERVQAAANGAQRIDYLYKRAQLLGDRAAGPGRGPARLRRDRRPRAAGRGRVGEAVGAVFGRARVRASSPSCANASSASSRSRAARARIMLDLAGALPRPEKLGDR